MLFFSAYVYADNPTETGVLVTLDGYTTGTCYGTSVYGYITYSGNYPDTSTPIATATSDSNCHALIELGTANIEGGWADNGHSTPDGHYWVKYTQEGSAFSPDYSSTWYYFSADRVGGLWNATGLNYLDGSSHIATVTPADGSLIATSTSYSIGSTGAINEVDFNDYSELEINLINSGDIQGCFDAICDYYGGGVPFPTVNLTYHYPLTTASSYIYSSTTSGLPIGQYTMKTKIITGDFCFLGYCLGTRTVVASTTIFTISTTTKADAIRNDVTNYVKNLASTTVAFTNCGITDFDLFICGSDLITWAFVPTSDAMTANIDRIKEGILHHAPFGYVYRLVDLLSATTTTNLPDTSFPLTIGEGSTTGMELGTTTLFQAQDIITGAGAVLDNIHDPIYHKTIKDVFEPWVQLTIAFAVLLTIIKDVLGSHKVTHRELTT